MKNKKGNFQEKYFQITKFLKMSSSSTNYDQISTSKNENDNESQSFNNYWAINYSKFERLNTEWNEELLRKECSEKNIQIHKDQS